MYLVTSGEENNPDVDSLTTEAATAIRIAEEASERRAGVLVRAWEVKQGELGLERLGPPLAEFRDGKRVDLGG